MIFKHLWTLSLTQNLGWHYSVTSSLFQRLNCSPPVTPKDFGSLRTVCFSWQDNTQFERPLTSSLYHLEPFLIVCFFFSQTIALALICADDFECRKIFFLRELSCSKCSSRLHFTPLSIGLCRRTIRMDAIANKPSL